MAARTTEALGMNVNSCLVHALFSSTLVLSTDAAKASSTVVQCQVSLSSGDLVLKSKDKRLSIEHMSCASHAISSSGRSTKSSFLEGESTNLLSDIAQHFGDVE